MDCRSHCGACCVAPSIHQPFYGMPNGKPAGESCIHLDDAEGCRLFGDARRPGLCAAFMPQPACCGNNRDEALALLAALEIETQPSTVRWTET